MTANSKDWEGPPNWEEHLRGLWKRIRLDGSMRHLDKAVYDTLHPLTRRMIERPVMPVGAIRGPNAEGHAGWGEVVAWQLSRDKGQLESVVQHAWSRWKNREAMKCDTGSYGDCYTTKTPRMYWVIEDRDDGWGRDIEFYPTDIAVIWKGGMVTLGSPNGCPSKYGGSLPKGAASWLPDQAAGEMMALWPNL